MTQHSAAVLLPDVHSLILTLRDQKVLLDADLALVYHVPTRVLNQALKRNLDRFPTDFAFQLTVDEAAAIRSQPVIASNRSPVVTASKRNLRYRPWAFTEHGALMAANILNSPRAHEMSVYVIRAFVKMRAALSGSQELKRRLAEIEKTLMGHDAALRDLYQKLRPLLVPPPEPKRREIGFHARPDGPSDPKGARK
jgi:hypothetical protein